MNKKSNKRKRTNSYKSTSLESFHPHRNKHFKSEKYSPHKKISSKKKSLNLSSQDKILYPHHFLCGGNMRDPLNLNGIANRGDISNSVTPSSSPPYPNPNDFLIPIIHAANVNDPLNLCGDDNQNPLVKPKSRTRRRRYSHKKKHNNLMLNSNSVDALHSGKSPFPSPIISNSPRESTNASQPFSTSSETTLDISSQSSVFSSTLCTVSALSSSSLSKVVSSSNSSATQPIKSCQLSKVSTINPLTEKNSNVKPDLIENKKLGNLPFFSPRPKSPILKSTSLCTTTTSTLSISSLNYSSSSSTLSSFSSLSTSSISKSSFSSVFSSSFKKKPQSTQTNHIKLKQTKHHQSDKSPSRSKSRQRRVKIKNKPNNHRYRNGSYNSHIGYMNDNYCDGRLDALSRELFEGKEVLEIGSNVGHTSIMIGKNYKVNKIQGIDIEPRLIQAAKKNLLYHSSNGPHGNKHFNLSYGPIINHPLAGLSSPHTPSTSSTSSSSSSTSSSSFPPFPLNVHFTQGDYVPRSKLEVDLQKEEYDIILALGITKHIHLNHGDEKLKLTFKKIFNQLRPGGSFFLQSQQWVSYKKKKRTSEKIFKNFKSIRFYPSQFEDFLLSPSVGFSSCNRVADIRLSRKPKGYQQSILEFTKAPTFPLVSTIQILNSSEPNTISIETENNDIEIIIKTKNLKKPIQILYSVPDQLSTQQQLFPQLTLNPPPLLSPTQISSLSPAPQTSVSLVPTPPTSFFISSPSLPPFSSLQIPSTENS